MPLNGLSCFSRFWGIIDVMWVKLELHPMMYFEAHWKSEPPQLTSFASKKISYWKEMFWTPTKIHFLLLKQFSNSWSHTLLNNCQGEDMPPVPQINIVWSKKTNKHICTLIKSKICTSVVITCFNWDIKNILTSECFFFLRYGFVIFV